jgi:HK97 family phage portal protein
MGLFDFFKKKGLNPNVQTPIMPVIFGGHSLGMYTKNNSEEAFVTNADVYAIISLLARKASSIPWYVYRKKKEKGAKIALERYKLASRQPFDLKAVEKLRAKALEDDEIAEDHPLYKLLQRPNPTQGQDKFFESLYIWYFINGEGFIWGNNGNIEGGEFVELYPLPSHRIDHIADPNDLFGVVGWKLNIKQGIYLNKENVLHWKMSNPEIIDDHVNIRGLSPLQAAYRVTMMGTEAETAGYSMMKNGGAKGALTPEPVNQQVPMISPEQAAAIKQHLKDYTNGAMNKGNIDVFQTPWKYLDFGLSSVDMQLIESQKITLHKLCRVFGVPVVLFEADYMTDNNYQNALRDLVTNTIVPAIASLRDELNRWLAKDGVYIDFDVQALPELQKDIEKLITGLANASFLTFDEKREALGYEPLGGAFDVAYVNSGLVKLEDVGMDLTIDDGSDPLDAGNN